MLGRVIWTEFFANRDWPAASAVAIVLLATLVVPILPVRAPAGEGAVVTKGPSAFNLASVVLGLGFLYAPIVILVAYSFNASRLVTVWGGFSTRWYVGPVPGPADAGRPSG
jgi:ABC-type spermidine/putrescine transport system permease subunit I